MVGTGLSSNKSQFTLDMKQSLGLHILSIYNEIKTNKKNGLVLFNVLWQIAVANLWANHLFTTSYSAK